MSMPQRPDAARCTRSITARIAGDAPITPNGICSAGRVCCGDAARAACSRAFASSASRSRTDGGRGSTSKTPARIASAAAEGRSGSAMPITTAFGCLFRMARANRIASPFCRRSMRHTDTGALSAFIASMLSTRSGS